MTASLIYDSFVDDLCNGAINPSTDTIKCLLVNGYTPSKASDAKRSDVTNEVANGNGYTTGGKGVTCTVAEGAGNTETLTFSNPAAWTSSTFTATGAVLYKSRGGAASADNLYAYVDFGGSVTATGAAFTVTLTTPLTFQN